MVISLQFLKRFLTGSCITIGLITLIFFVPFYIFSLSMLTIFSIITIYELPTLLKRISTKLAPLKNYRYFNYRYILKYFTHSLLNISLILYTALPIVAIIALHKKNKWLTFLLFLLVFSHDTGSYIAGKLWGRHKICPKISPSKTWQGFFGGCILTLFSSYLFIYIYNSLYNSYKISLTTSKQIVIVFLISITTSIIAFLGDIFESYLKRLAKVKDIGNILPGHGGILDRLDSIIPTALLFYIIQSYILKYFLSIS